MKEGYEKYCRNGLCEGESRPKKYNLDEHCHEDLKDKCWYSGCQCPGERLIIPKEQPKYPIGGYAPGNYMCNCSTCKTQFQGDKRAVQCEPCAIKMTKEEIQPQQIWNKEKMEEVKKLIQKQKLIDMMGQDEQLGLYEETKCYCGHTTTCDCGPEQETLEEAGVAYAKTVDQNHTSHMLGFLNGARWQQERSYSEEEVLVLLQDIQSQVGIDYNDNFMFADKWFEQFKKK